MTALITRPTDLPPSGHYASTHLSLLRNEYAYYLANAIISPWARVTAQTFAGSMVANRTMYGGHGLPFWFIGILHRMECDANPECQIANGEPWNRVTRLVPRGLGPWSSFAESIPVILDDYAKPANWGIDLRTLDPTDLPACLYRLESWNGFGAREMHGELNTTPPNSPPYIYSGSECDGHVLFVKGKDVTDNHFDPEAKSTQVGVLALMLALKSQGVING